MPNRPYFATVTVSAALAAGAFAQNQYTNDSNDDFLIDKIDFAVSLQAALGGAIVGTEIAKFPSPTAASNTHVTRAQFTVEIDDGEFKYMNGPIPLSALQNPEGETFLTTPIRLAAQKRLTIKVTNNTTTATVLVVANLFGRRVAPGTND